MVHATPFVGNLKNRFPRFFRKPLPKVGNGSQNALLLPKQGFGGLRVADDFICNHLKSINLVSIKITTHLLEHY